MPVGDINSAERGSGARFNDGKPDLSLIPLWMVGAFMYEGTRSDWPEDEDHEQRAPCTALFALSEFQMNGRLKALYRTVRWLYGRDAAAMHKAVCDAADVFSYGARKYAAWNWTKGMNWSIPLACAARHICAIIRGEETDPESGLPHAGHVVCNIMMLLYFEEGYPEGNDLPWGAGA